MCFSCITNGRLVVSVFSSLFSSGINHRFVSMSLGPSIITLLSFITWTSPLLKTTVQLASHSTGTEINDRSISLNPCACTGRLGASCSWRVVTEFIVFVLATPTLISSCRSSFPRCLCFLDRNMLVAAESGCPCGTVLSFNIAMNLFVSVDRRVILLLVAFVTAAAYDICLLEDDV